jgi:hypothetical protein
MKVKIHSFPYTSYDRHTLTVSSLRKNHIHLGECSMIHGVFSFSPHNLVDNIVTLPPSSSVVLIAEGE